MTAETKNLVSAVFYACACVARKYIVYTNIYAKSAIVLSPKG